MKYLQKFNESLNANPESDLPLETIKDYFSELIDNYDVEIEDVKEDYDYVKIEDNGEYTHSSIRSNGYNYYYRTLIVRYQSFDRSPLKLMSLTANIQKDIVDIIIRLESSLDMTFIKYNSMDFEGDNDNYYSDSQITLEFIHPVNDESTLISNDELSNFILFLKKSILSFPNSIIDKSKFTYYTKDNKIFIDCPTDSNVNKNTVRTLKKTLEEDRANGSSSYKHRRKFLYDFDVKPHNFLYRVTIENISKNEKFWKN